MRFVEALMHQVKEKVVSANFPSHGLVTALLRPVQGLLTVELRKEMRAWESTASKL